MNAYRYIPLISLSLALAGPTALAADGDDTTSKQPEQQQAGHGDHRGQKQLMIENAQGAEITLWRPDLTTQSLQTHHGAVTLPKTGMDNYHALVVEKDWGTSKETLIRYEYRFGRPSKRSPSELTSANKTEFEIVPAPVPREHYRYHSDQQWGFQVRLHGQPVVGQPLTLETEHGSRLESVTNNAGYAEFRIPDDFPDLVEGQRDRRSAEFNVSAVTDANGVAYQTTLSASYRVNPSHWQSHSMGWVVVGLGFIAGGLIGRQRGQGGKGA
jgi:hypothetical protein